MVTRQLIILQSDVVPTCKKKLSGETLCSQLCVKLHLRDERTDEETRLFVRPLFVRPFVHLFVR